MINYLTTRGTGEPFPILKGVTMTDNEILESLKVYTSKPEIIDCVLKLKTSVKNAINEIENNIQPLSTNDTYKDGITVGLIRALDIINKHLKGA